MSEYIIPEASESVGRFGGTMAEYEGFLRAAIGDAAESITEIELGRYPTPADVFALLEDGPAAEWARRKRIHEEILLDMAGVGR